MKLRWLVFLFICVELVTAQFTVEPVSVVQAEGLEAVFECLYPGATVHLWEINGTFPTDDEFPTDVIRTPPSGGSPAKLIIPAIPVYNNTFVHCEAVLRDGGGGVFVLVMSENTTLQVQGPLSPTTNLYFMLVYSTNTTITISWTPLFSLNLTTAEPDIQYCVDVYNVTEGGADLLESVCDITDTSYTFSASDPDQLFNFTVTPRSNVESSLNGTTSQPVQGYLILNPIQIPTDAIAVDVTYKSSGQVEVQVQVFFPAQVLGTSPGRIPTHYVITLTDIETHEPCVCPALPVRDKDMILLSLNCAHEIDAHRKFTMTLTSLNSIGEAVSEPPLEISTHDVQTVNTLYSESVQQLDITCSYLTGSSGRGYFVILYTDTQTIYRVVYRSGSEANTTVCITDCQFEDSAVVAVYDLLSDFGVPEGRPAAVQQSSEIAKTNSTLSGDFPSSLPPLPFESTVTHPSNGVVCLSCSFSSAALTGCVGVIHSALVDSLTLTVLTVDSSGGIDCTVLTEGDYHVTVFGLSVNGLGEFPANQSVVEVLPPITTQAATDPDINIVEVSKENVALIAGGATLGGAVVLLLLCVCITSTCVCRRRKTLGRFDLTQAQHDTPEGLHEIEGAADRVDWSTAFPGIEQPNEAYSTVMNRSIAYEQTKKPRRQRKRKRQQQPLTPAPEESTHTAVVQYENVTDLQEEHLYEETLPKDTVPVESTVDGVAVGAKETERVHYENTEVAQYTGTKQKYENVCLPTGGVLHKPYVNVDIVD